jgi:hypothetical protein
MGGERDKMKLKSIIWLLVLATICGCGDPIKDPSELVGTWELTEESREYLSKEFGMSATTVVLDSSGLFTVQNFPQMKTYSDYKTDVSGLSGRGKWKLSRDTIRQIVILWFSEFIEGSTATRVSYGEELFIDRFSGELILYLHLGDPDSAPRIEFTRSK